jgi:methionyl-tRNA formyltransferase
MKKTSKPIVFFGSGPVAAASLELLVKDFEIESVITKPRAAHHKGAVPVLELCKKLSIPIYTPVNRAELSDLFKEKPVANTIGIVIDYGIIINQDVIDYFSYGIINSHFSLLPEWRGADPITFAILSGQKQTGVSVMRIKDKLDEGPLLGAEAYDIKPQETTPSLTHNLILLSHSLLTDLIPGYLDGTVVPRSQESIATTLGRPTKPSYSRKLTKNDGIIDWEKPAVQIEREIRAFLGWPGSRTSLLNKEVVITKAEVTNDTGTPGDIARTKKSLTVFCGENSLSILSLKPDGKKDMPIESFLAGIPINDN